MFLIYALATTAILVLLINIFVVMRIGTLVGGSLPSLTGQRRVAGLPENATIRIETDASGVPHIIGHSADTVAYGLGYAHARDRFFQMDLARRYAAGELAEILGGGKSVVETDTKLRRHRFRALCQRVVANMDENDRSYLDSYTAGVNQALADLRKKPWEYFLLKCKPAPWQPADVLLVSQSIYLFLESGDLPWHSANGLIHDILPRELAEFLTPRGSGWDAPIVGDSFTVPPIPSAEVVNLRKSPEFQSDEPVEPWTRLETKVLGSTGWLVSGKKAHGGRPGPALVANDMHLGLGLPPTWYKVSLTTIDKITGQQHNVHGVTLPGGPPVVAGANGKIAWGLTSAQGDWGDLLILEIDPQNPRRYKTPQGWAEMQSHVETIRIKGSADQQITVDWTHWGPVVDTDLQGRPRVWRWVAQEPEGVNLTIGKIAHCNSVEEAVALAPDCGVPHVNFLVGDTQGHIGWTILGRIPRRVGLGQVDERRPMMAADPNSAWDGYLTSDEAPSVIDPPSGLIWSANHRMVSGDMLAKIGQGRYDRGVRATRIRDLLISEENYHEATMLKIQMENTALLLQQWRDRILSDLPDDVVLIKSDRATFRNHLEKWSGRADAASIGYALLTECRLRLVSEVLSPLVAPIRRAEVEAGRKKPQFALRHIGLETPAWAILSQQPPHLLPSKYNSWQELLLHAVDDTIQNASKLGWPTWGEVNKLQLAHPFGEKIKFLKAWLAAPVIHSSGSLTDMPKIQSPEFGASQRLAVFPGRENQGMMQLPGGQSAHPMSPHYLDLLHDWSHNGHTPLVAGAAKSVFILKG